MAATNKRGVFSLETVLERQDSNSWSKIPDVFRYVNTLAVPETTGGPAYGYFAGGENSTNQGISSVDRIDYGNDTATAAPKGPLSTPARNFGSASSNTSYGYFGGGPGAPSIIDRLDFGNDTATATPKGPLTQIGHGLTGWSGGMNGLPQFGG